MKVDGRRDSIEYKVQEVSLLKQEKIRFSSSSLTPLQAIFSFCYSGGGLLKE